jgi:hypothetical protein
VSLRPVTIEQFPGLDLRSDPGDSRGALDLSNVTIERMRLRVRDGSSLLFTLVANPDGVYSLSEALQAGGTTWSIGMTNLSNTLTAFRAVGAPISSAATTTFQNGSSVVALGTSSASLIFASATFKLWQFNGTTWTDVSPASGLGVGPLCSVLGVSPTDNRLVACNGSVVYFSDPGLPSTFTGSNFVQVTPGDGEDIQSVVTFNNQVFVFKATKFFVFYGQSVDSTGKPIFNYRAVDTGIGVHQGFQSTLGHPGHAVAGEDAVYFLSARGIYRTTGGPPVCISSALQPFFDGTTSPFWQGGAWTPSYDFSKLLWLNGKLYFASSAGIFVWDRDLDAWSWWNLQVSALGSLPRTNTGDLPVPLYGNFNTRQIRLMGPGLTTDDGVAIVSRYRLPFETYGTPGEKRIRETLVEGTGTPTVQWSRDWGALTTGSTVTLGTSPAIAVGRQRQAIRGRAFSLQLGAASGAWAVNRVQPNIGEGVRGVEVTV